MCKFCSKFFCHWGKESMKTSVFHLFEKPAGFLDSTVRLWLEKGKCCSHRQKIKRDNSGNCRLGTITSVPGKILEWVFFEFLGMWKRRWWLRIVSTDLLVSSPWPTQLCSVIKWLSLWVKGKPWVSFTLTLGKLSASSPAVCWHPDWHVTAGWGKGIWLDSQTARV